MRCKVLLACSLAVAGSIAALGIRLAFAGPSVEPDPITFEDVAGRAGVRFVLHNSATPEKHQIEPMVSGVAVFDYNNDGKPDIYFVNGAQQPRLEKPDPSFYNRLYRNNGDGTFTDITLEAGVRGEGFATGVAAADYDNDGFTDLFSPGSTATSFTAIAATARSKTLPQAAGLAHMRGPAGSRGRFRPAGSITTTTGCLTCSWSTTVSGIPEQEPACTIGKYPHVLPSEILRGLPNQLYHNNGDGTFTDVSAASGIAVAHRAKEWAVSFLDFDQDGRLDVFVTNDTAPNFLFRNEGGGTVSRGRLGGRRGVQRRRPRGQLDGRRRAGHRQ